MYIYIYYIHTVLYILDKHSIPTKPAQKRCHFKIFGRPPPPNVPSLPVRLLPGTMYERHSRDIIICVYGWPVE